jgi:hypothetical protein
MEDLIGRMTHEDPARRPRIEEVLQNFTNIRQSLSKSKLRSAITSRKAPKIFGLIQKTRHTVRTVKYVVLRRPAIPDPYA